MKIFIRIWVIYILFFLNNVIAQESQGGVPAFYEKEQTVSQLKSGLMAVILPSLNNEDEKQRADSITNASCKDCKSKFYGKGISKSVVWWTELCDKLIKSGYIRQDLVKGRFMYQVLKITHKGITWASMAGLEDYGIERMEPVEMIADN